MGLTRPSLQTIISRIEDDIESAIGSTSPLLPRSVLRVIARVFGGAVHLVYGFATWMSKQVFPDTAEAEYQERWASIWGIQRNPATYAACTIEATGIAGSSIPALTRWISAGGTEYESTDDAEIGVDETASVSVQARTSGTLGNTIVGQVLTLVSPVAGVDSGATVDAITTVAYDAETDASLLERLLSRIQRPPHGGAEFDYVTWARETPDIRVTRAWAYENYAGPGTVGVTFATDDDGDPFPSETERSAVADYIETKRPLCATVTVFIPDDLPINISLSVTPNTDAVKDAVEQAISDYIKEAGYPGNTVYLSKLNEAISGATGEVDHSLTAPSANIEVGINELATVGTITWA